MLSCDEHFARQYNRIVIKMAIVLTLHYPIDNLKPKMDVAIRFVVSISISYNKEIFIPINVNSIDQHCARMCISGTRVTLVEVVAAATVFMIPVYFITLSREVSSFLF